MLWPVVNLSQAGCSIETAERIIIRRWVNLFGQGRGLVQAAGSRADGWAAKPSAIVAC